MKSSWYRRSTIERNGIYVVHIIITIIIIIIIIKNVLIIVTLHTKVLQGYFTQINAKTLQIRTQRWTCTPWSLFMSIVQRQSETASF